METAENRKSIEGMLDLVTDDFLVVFHNAMISGRAELADWLKESAKNYISSKHAPMRVDVSPDGNMAWVFGYELNKRERDNGVVETKQYYILTFRKVDGQWKQSAVCIA